MAGAETAYVEKSEQIHSEIQTALMDGTAFADAAEKQKLELKITAPFNVSSQLEDEFGREIKAGAILFGKGQLTDLIATPDEFLVAFVAEKIPGDETATLPGMRDELTSNIENEKSSQLVATWRDALLDEAGFEDLIPRTNNES